MTKAERIYKSTRFECKHHISVFGLDFNPNGKAVGFNNLITEEAISVRTINAVEKELEKDKKDTAIAYKLEVITQEQLNERAKTWLMIESTIANARESLK